MARDAEAARLADETVREDPVCEDPVCEDPVEPCPPWRSAAASGIAAMAEPTPRATANAPIRPT